MNGGLPIQLGDESVPIHWVTPQSFERSLFNLGFAG